MKKLLFVLLLFSACTVSKKVQAPVPEKTPVQLEIEKAAKKQRTQIAWFMFFDGIILLYLIKTSL